MPSVSFVRSQYAVFSVCRPPWLGASAGHDERSDVPESLAQAMIQLHVLPPYPWSKLTRTSVSSAGTETGTGDAMVNASMSESESEVSLKVEGVEWGLLLYRIDADRLICSAASSLYNKDVYRPRR